MFQLLHSEFHAFAWRCSAEIRHLTNPPLDMQRVGVNTIAVDTVEELRGGDLLALARDKKAGIAHHIQVFHSRSRDEITIFQGNSGVMGFGFLGLNPADPQNVAYTGKSIQLGVYSKEGEKWNYRNITTARVKENFLRYMELYRWNFMEFNQ